MTRRYTGGFLSAKEQVTDTNTANGVFTLAEAQEKTALGNFPTGRWTPQYSLRFRRANKVVLTRAPAAAGNRTTWTWSGWLKLGTNSGDFAIFHAGSSDANRAALYWDAAAQHLNWGYRNSSTWVYTFATPAVFRDPSAWYHIVLAFDTTNGVATNRNRLYVNGVRQTVTETGTCSLNDTSQINSTDIHSIGANWFFFGTNDVCLDGYMSELNFIDGQALDPSYFGATDPETSVWVPKRYTGSYGTNGFYLPLNPNYSGTVITPQIADLSVDFMVLGGGGGGGAYDGGGGGGGGLRSSVTTTGGGSSLESTLGLALNTAYTITVGAGGSGQNGATLASNGYKSVFASVTSLGGGHGGGYSGVWLTSTAGGCGGGGAYAGNGWPGSPGAIGQGYGGGNGDQATNAGGGGGTGQAGGNATASVGGKGGDGAGVQITGSNVSYGGGGGGAGYPAGGGSAGAGGAGGGAAGGANATGGNGTANLGGGGGGSQDTATPPARAGGNGGSGVVIIKIPNTRTATFSAGVTSSMSTAVAGYKVYTVTATSTTSETVTFS